MAVFVIVRQCPNLFTTLELASVKNSPPFAKIRCYTSRWQHSGNILDLIKQAGLVELQASRQSCCIPHGWKKAGTEELNDDFAAIDWKGRDVYLVPD
jgi:hypothetical protein